MGKGGKEPCFLHKNVLHHHKISKSTIHIKKCCPSQIQRAHWFQNLLVSLSKPIKMQVRGRIVSKSQLNFILNEGRDLKMGIIFKCNNAIICHHIGIWRLWVCKPGPSPLEWGNNFCRVLSRVEEVVQTTSIIFLEHGLHIWPVKISLSYCKG